MDIKDIAEQSYKNGAKDALNKMRDILEHEKTKFAEDIYIVYINDIDDVLNYLKEIYK